MMSVGRLITFCSTFTKLPVYAEDVRDQIVELGVQDEIHFVPIDVPPERLRGMFVRGRRRDAVSNPANTSFIFYNVNVTPDEQNFICIKELMHVFDNHALSRASSLEALMAHVDYLFEEPRLGPARSLSGFLDDAARYMALAVMFPHEIRDDFIAVHKAGISHDAIAAVVGIDPSDAIEVLSPAWEAVRDILLRF